MGILMKSFFAVKAISKQIKRKTSFKILLGITISCVLAYWTVIIIKHNKARMAIVAGKNLAARYLEERASEIKHLMYWKNASLFDDITCKSDNRITSCAYSKIQILNVDTVTRTVDVGIYLYDRSGNVKTNGGDLILIWAEKLSTGKVAGHVTDYMNGSYHGRIKMPWSGLTKISAKLVSAKENLCLRLKAMKKYGNSVFALNTPYGIHSAFTNRSVTEFTRCSPERFVYGYDSVCNFTSLNYGFSWYCGRPTRKGLNCDSFTMSKNKPYDKSQIVTNQPKDEVIYIPGHCVFQQSLEVFIDYTSYITSTSSVPELLKCSSRPKKDSWTEPSPTGYSKGKWKFNNCFSNVQLEAKSLRKCLNGKRISFIGDSTVQQYLEMLSDILKLKASEFHNIPYSDVQLTWKRHEMPIHSTNWIIQDSLQSSVFHIDELANDVTVSGSASIVVIHYGLHLQAFSPTVYKSRLKLLVEALKRLLDKKPETTIFVKGAAPVIDDYTWFDARISLMYNEILFREFAPLQDHVIYLDVFSIYVANNNQDFNPTGQTMINQAQQLLAYIC